MSVGQYGFYNPSGSTTAVAEDTITPIGRHQQPQTLFNLSPGTLWKAL
jgi:hypothetical protein